MSVKIVKDDTKRILSAISSMTEKEVLVGIPSKENHRNGSARTNSEIGYINEKGSPLQNIPARPWLVPGVESATKKIIGVLERSAKKAVVEKGAIEKGLNAAGIIAQSSVKNYIRKGENFKPLSDATLKSRKSKGFLGEKPLIETGQLINSVTYVIRKK